MSTLNEMMQKASEESLARGTEEGLATGREEGREEGRRQTPIQSIISIPHDLAR